MRFCRQCRLNVYNLSELTRPQAETLLAKTEARICVRFYRRADGTVLTQDCPVGLKALRQRISRRAAAALGLIFSLCLPLVGKSRTQDPSSCVSRLKITRKDLSTQETSVVGGTVLDPNGAVVAGAHVGITNASTQKSSVRQTDDEGKFQFASVVAGTYLVRIELPGFKTYEIKDLKIEAKQLTQIELTLELSADTELVGVIAMPDTLDTSGSNQRVIDAETIKRLPINP